jgi:hypothetical protein
MTIPFYFYVTRYLTIRLVLLMIFPMASTRSKDIHRFLIYGPFVQVNLMRSYRGLSGSSLYNRDRTSSFTDSTPLRL